MLVLMGMWLELDTLVKAMNCSCYARNLECNATLYDVMRSIWLTVDLVFLQIFDHHNKRLRKTQAKEPKDNSSKTIFTDRDFDKFEKEYNFD